MSKLAAYLNQHIVGNVFDRPLIRQSFATDRSMVQVTPRLVAQPANTGDVRKLVRFTNQLSERGFELPITVRGTGLDKTGASLGDGLVIAMSGLNKIEEIDARGRLIRVQPGITLGDLNAILSTYGLWLPIGADDEATIGGLIANCAHDELAQRYGGIYHFVERAEIVTASGDVMQFAGLTGHGLHLKKSLQSAEGELYCRVEEVLDRHADTIVDRGMRPFDCGGYANVTRVREGRNFNLLPLMFAAQGTLGIVTDVILRLELLPTSSRQMLAVFDDFLEAEKFLNAAKELDPASLKIYDLRILHEAARRGKAPDFLTAHRQDGWLALARFDGRKLAVARKIERLEGNLAKGTLVLVEKDSGQAEFQTLHSAFTSFLNDVEAGERLSVLDDVFVPAHRLDEFLTNLQVLEQVLGLELPLYGSFANSNYQVRPRLNLADLAGRRAALDFLQRFAQLVANHEGSITGGSPEGRTKILPTGLALPERELALYRELKAVFDPQNILNPKVKLGAEYQDLVRCLRTGGLGGIMSP